MCDEECAGAGARGGAGGRVCGTDGNTYESEVRRQLVSAAFLESSFRVIIII